MGRLLEVKTALPVTWNSLSSLQSFVQTITNQLMSRKWIQGRTSDIEETNWAPSRSCPSRSKLKHHINKSFTCLQIAKLAGIPYCKCWNNSYFWKMEFKKRHLTMASFRNSSSMTIWRCWSILLHPWNSGNYLNKAGYTAELVACDWAGAVMRKLPEKRR